MAEDVDLPDEIFGFGSWLLWLIATRATDLVDQMFEAGPPRRSRVYGTVEGHHVPTPSLIAWMLTAAEAGLPLHSLAGGGPRLAERQKILRTQVSRAIAQDARLFRDSWLRTLALQCGLSDIELDLLLSSRDEHHYPVRPEQLRDAIARTFKSEPVLAVRAGQHVAVSRMLPRPSAAFTGRDREVGQLIAAVDTGNSDVHVIGGMAGVGKSALAVRLGWQLAERFPDGQFYLPLHGHTPGLRPADPLDALAGLLLADGVSATQIPAGLAARADKWRERTAGRRLMLILDDAVSAQQVRPLLPGTAGCLVLITSRRRLTSLEDARTISLETLPRDETALLIARLAARPGDDDDPAMAELARLCGCLPLAAGMIGRKLHHHPAWSAAGLAADMVAARDRLQLMTAEDTSVAIAFDLSYADLTAEQQRLFRRLTGHQGTSIDACAAAALGGTDAHAARRGLEALYDHYLLAEPSAGRYVFHDLVRDYAGTLASADPPEEGEAAVRRLLDYYAHTARAANRLIDRRFRVDAGLADAADQQPPVPVPMAAPAFAGREEAMAWMDMERLSLGAVASIATSAGRPGHAVAIPAAMHAYLRAAGHWDQGLAVQTGALIAARRSGDLRAQAAVLLDLGEMLQARDDMSGATESYAAALDVAEQLADKLGQAKALAHLGSLDYLTSDYASSADKLTRALDLFRGLGDRLGQAEALTHLGYLHYVGDRNDAAVECLTTAIELSREIDDRPGQFGALNYLAHVQHQTGQFLAATAGLARALALAQAEGDVHAQGAILTTLGNSQRLTGHYTDALASLTSALQLSRQAANTNGEASALNYLGVVQRETGDAREAIASQEQARDLYRRRGSRLGQANALMELGIAQKDMGRFDDAAASLDAALALYQEIGEQLGEAEVLSSRGDLMVASGQAGLARDLYERALALARPVSAPQEQAHALAGLGECLLADGLVTAGTAALREALAIYGEIDTPDARRLERILREHDPEHALHDRDRPSPAPPPSPASEPARET
jgi:tetratricopeptide (TPR) repeat protein